ncbi:MAG TPA: S8 family peptidase [Candidatus Limnocylindrales bacterium]|nr:S8 family peptidase [Candidatus Limnocylindrales bacterium]
MRHEKIAPQLMVALENYQEEGRVGLIRHMRSLGVIPSVGSPKPARAVVFIHCEEQARLDNLAQYGIRVNQSRGKIRTALLPIESIGPLSDDPAVERIISSHYLRLRMDVAPGKVHIPEFRRNSRLSGKGVIIGIVDTGIDPNHPAFLGRILRIWDQTLTGPGVAEGGYGLELTGAQLTASRDREGHGTHVAGIAAGFDPVFGGIAPGADLVIVKSDLQDAHIADGIRYIFRVAHDLGRAAVVNLSLGGHYDAHDGSDSLSQIIDMESGEGRIVCCAAGNEGNDNIHAQGVIPAGTLRTVRFRVPTGTVHMAALNGWYSGANSLEVSLRTPGKFVTPFQGVISSGSYVKTYPLPDARIRIATPGPDPANGDHNFFIEMGAPPGLPVKGGIWQLRVRNISATDARLDIWTLDDQISPEVVFTGASVKDSMKIGSPGAAASAITVASYTTKVQWTDIDGHVRTVGLVLDDISDFSSEGPLRNGKQKPDVTAPGAMIVSCLSADSQPSRAEMVNPNFLVMAGTSMATPFIAGIVALLLERDPKLGPQDVKTLLRAHSLIPGQPAGIFDPKWGFGLIDALGL